ncbi:hypothetical protein I4U23_010294 [Adineta vaga]|nr:hypothetical protein I4U23_010294 [Adineta vaga]
MELPDNNDELRLLDNLQQLIQQKNNEIQKLHEKIADLEKSHEKMVKDLEDKYVKIIAKLENDIESLRGAKLHLNSFIPVNVWKYAPIIFIAPMIIHFIHKLK